MPGLTFAGAALEQHASHLLRVVPRRQVPAPAQHDAAHAVRQRPRPRDEPVVLRPGQRDRHGISSSAREAARAHRVVDGLRSRARWRTRGRAAARRPAGCAPGGRRWPPARAGGRARCAAAGRAPAAAPARPRAPACAWARAARRHRPAGAIAVDRRARARPAPSRAPPSRRASCRRRAGARSPRAASHSAIAAASAAGEPSASGGAPPKPGRSSASTRRSPSSRSSTGSHMRWSVPSVCRRTSGSLSGRPPPPPPR